MDVFKRPVIIVIILVAIIMATFWSYWQNRKQKSQQSQTQTQTETPKIVNLTNVDSADFDSVIKDEYALANSKAQEVSTGYKLAAVEVELPGLLQPNSGNSRYIFSQESDTKNNWIITISQNTGNYIRAAIPKEDYLGNVAVMNTKLWKFNYVTALQIAEKNGGLEWREKNTIKNARLILRHTQPNNWLTWTVEYASEGSSFSKVIDANSGQIIETNT